MKVIVILATLFVAACGAGTQSAASSPTSGQGTTSGLVLSQYPDCNQRGEALAAYLRTGQPTSLDPIYGNERQRVLALSGEARDLAIRQYGDAYIQHCAEAAAASATFNRTPLPTLIPKAYCPSGFELTNAGCCPPIKAWVNGVPSPYADRAHGAASPGSICVMPIPTNRP